MRLHLLPFALTALATLSIVPVEGHGQEVLGAPTIPQSIQAEHHEIHEALVAATKLQGQVGEAARNLAKVLHPHFVREEEIALPPLGVLAPLASGQMPSGTDAVLQMTDQLRRELPRMLEEHTQIRSAVQKLGETAAAEGNAQVSRLAEALALHARTEEEVLYPAAVLVGDVIRARQAGK